jgi:hypothetical protein
VSPRAIDRTLERARHQHAQVVLEQVLSVCRSSGIDVLPVKGVLTAHLWYRDPGERPIQDVDLRVVPGDLRRVEQAGVDAGWRLLLRSRAYGALAFDVLGFLVEFESHVGPPGLCGLRVEAMLKRALRRTEPLRMPHLQPEIHDHALLLCVNAFKDKLVDAPAGAVRDLELLPGQPGFSPDRLAALARDSGAASITWIVASWLAEARDCAAWNDVRERLGGRAPRRLYALLFDRARRASPAMRPILRVLTRAGADRRAQQVRALLAMGLKLVEGAFRGPPRGMSGRLRAT